MDKMKQNLIIFLLFFVMAEVLLLTLHQGVQPFVAIAGVAVLFVVVIRCMERSSDTVDNYTEPRDFQPSLRSVCKGGAYMWQGDTPLDKACRQLYATDPESIRNPDYTYMRGAKPYADFRFDPIIDDNFEFVRCKNKQP